MADKTRPPRQGAPTGPDPRMDTMKSSEFLAEAEKMQLEINPVSGDAVQTIVREVYRTPKAVAAAVAQMVN